MAVRFPDTFSRLSVSIHDYEIGESIGIGGFGAVFKCHDKKNNVDVALKVVNLISTMQNSNEIINIVREITVPEILPFPGILKLIGFRFPLTQEQKATADLPTAIVRVPGAPPKKIDFSGAIIVTELMRNGSLDKLTPQYLKAKGVDTILNPTVRSKIIFGVAATMKRVHYQGVIHRDLKDANVFLDDNLEPKIADFGLSKVLLNNVEMTMAIGTPMAMAPEIFAEGSETYDQSVDVFAFAFFIMKMFTEVIQFSKAQPKITNFVYMREISKGNRPLRQPGIPDHFWDLINQCWAQLPEDRPTFEEITNLLKDDKYALSEFGKETNLDELHEYQERIDVNDEISFSKSQSVINTTIGKKTVKVKSFSGKFSTQMHAKSMNRKNEFDWHRH